MDMAATGDKTFLNWKQVVSLIGLGTAAARKLRENGYIRPAFPKRKGQRTVYRRSHVEKILNG